MNGAAQILRSPSLGALVFVAPGLPCHVFWPRVVRCSACSPHGPQVLARRRRARPPRAGLRAPPRRAHLRGPPPFVSRGTAGRGRGTAQGRRRGPAYPVSRLSARRSIRFSDTNMRSGTLDAVSRAGLVAFQEFLFFVDLSVFRVLCAAARSSSAASCGQLSPQCCAPASSRCGTIGSRARVVRRWPRFCSTSSGLRRFGSGRTPRWRTCKSLPPRSTSAKWRSGPEGQATRCAGRAVAKLYHVAKNAKARKRLIGCRGLVVFALQRYMRSKVSCIRNKESLRTHTYDVAEWRETQIMLIQQSHSETVPFCEVADLEDEPGKSYLLESEGRGRCRKDAGVRREPLRAEHRGVVAIESRGAREKVELRNLESDCVSQRLVLRLEAHAGVRVLSAVSGPVLRDCRRPQGPHTRVCCHLVSIGNSYADLSRPGLWENSSTAPPCLRLDPRAFV